MGLSIIPRASPPITSLVNTTAAKGNTNASTAAASTLSGPYAVGVDNSTGDVYIADTSNNKIAAVAANSGPWASTVFILNYDENDGLFDHVPPITPPAGALEEFVTLESPGGTPGGGLPIGAGFRVPCIIISPWTVGGYVCSDPFDHTSVLQFIEAVCFNGEAVNPNISAWRRSTFGNLTSAFQGTPSTMPPSNPNFSYSATAAELATQTANTSGSTKLPLPTFPEASQTPPVQQSGSRPSIG